MYKLILYPIAFVVFVLSSVRNKLYDFKILKRTYSKLPVISIGNIQMGGTGKTPFVVSLCEKLLQKNIQPIIITRGYKRNSNTQIFFKTLNEYSVQEVGDEPYLQKLKLPDVNIIIDQNKSQAIKMANNLSDIDCIILDDGFQSNYIEKNIEIVLINNWHAEKKFKIFPIGQLIESATNLKKADYIFTTKGNNHYKILNHYNAQSLNISYEILDDKSKKIRPSDLIKLNSKKKIYGLCGIANPEQFFESLESLKINCDKKIKVPNHFDYNKYNRQLIDNENIIYITTYKDYFKTNFKKSTVFVLDMCINIEDETLIKNIKNLI